MAVSRPPHLTRFVVRLFERRDLQAAQNLIFFGYNIHTHLDWHTVEEYLLSQPMRLWVAYLEDRLVGVLGFSEPLGGTNWLRIAAVADEYDPTEVLGVLFDDALPLLRYQGVGAISILVIRDWIIPTLAQLDFLYRETITSLQRYGEELTSPSRPRPEIFRMEPPDAQLATQIDHQAFLPPWQLTEKEMFQAIRVGSYCTFAAVGAQIVGYQISTRQGFNGHLARLGVAPNAQGNGVGAWLLCDALEAFNRRRIAAFSVNTQETNTRSLELYQRYGFHQNGYNLPVWTLYLSG